MEKLIFYVLLGQEKLMCIQGFVSIGWFDGYYGRHGPVPFKMTNYQERISL